ncbi:MAG: polysaccharide lyase family protein, partial [Acidobacteriaceae bacterium]
MKLKTAVLCGSILLALPVVCTTLAKAQAKGSSAVFTIGTFDRSSAEFAGGAPHQPVNFIAGESSPAKDWYAAQPAKLVSAAGAHPANDAAAPRTITFSLVH